MQISIRFFFRPFVFVCVLTRTLATTINEVETVRNILMILGRIIKLGKAGFHAEVPCILFSSSPLFYIDSAIRKP